MQTNFKKEKGKKEKEKHSFVSGTRQEATKTEKSEIEKKSDATKPRSTSTQQHNIEPTPTPTRVTARHKAKTKAKKAKIIFFFRFSLSSAKQNPVANAHTNQLTYRGTNASIRTQPTPPQLMAVTNRIHCFSTGFGLENRRFFKRQHQKTATLFEDGGYWKQKNSTIDAVPACSAAGSHRESANRTCL